MNIRTSCNGRCRSSTACSSSCTVGARPENRESEQTGERMKSATRTILQAETELEEQVLQCTLTIVNTDPQLQGLDEETLITLIRHQNRHNGILDKMKQVLLQELQRIDGRDIRHIPAAQRAPLICTLPKNMPETPPRKMTAGTFLGNTDLQTITPSIR